MACLERSVSPCAVGGFLRQYCLEAALHAVGEYPGSVHGLQENTYKPQEQYGRGDEGDR